jgi:hypothetical protein
MLQIKDALDFSSKSIQLKRLLVFSLFSITTKEKKQDYAMAMLSVCPQFQFLI